MGNLGKDNPKQRQERFASSFFADSEISYLPDEAKTIKPSSAGNIRRIFYRLVSAVFIIFLVSGGFLFAKFYSVGKKITIRNEAASPLEVLSSLVSPDHKKLRGEEAGRINILLLGAAGKGKPGQNLTDTVMLMSIDTRDNRAALLSLPRDLYVHIPGTRNSAKINSIYQYGLNTGQGAEPVRQAVQEITGQPVHYFLVVDFEGFTKIIDDIGGINVMVERDIYDSRYPGPNYSYETFELKKGFQHLDGPTALKYVRERHDDPDGDFGRAKRQQQVIQSVKNKVFSAETFLNVFTLNRMFETLEENIRTDIPIEEIESFISLSRRVDTQNIANKVIDAWEKDSLLKVSHVFFGNARAFILIPRAGSYGEINELAENIFDLEAIRRRRTEIEKEDASIALVNQSGDSSVLTKVKKLLKDQLDLEVISAENGPKGMTAEKTLVFSETSQEKFFTLDELIKKIPAALASGKNDIMNKADITVVLGQDLISIYSFEEDSAEEFKRAENNQEYFIN